MSTDIVISGAAYPNFYSGLQHPISRDTVNSEMPTFKYGSDSNNVAFSERESQMNGFDQDPEVHLFPSGFNARSTSAAHDETKITRVLEQHPVIRLPQKVIEQKFAVNVIDADAVAIQIWEGCVHSVDYTEKVMKASLNAKMGSIPEHMGNIDLQWVSDQDTDLVMPGAIFYLTLFKRTKIGGSIENAQTLRFRRRPNWSKTQLDNIDKRANTFLSKFKSGSMSD